MKNTASLDQEAVVALADLACTLTAAILWVVVPQVGTWPLVLALIPWALRLAEGKFPFKRTVLDIPILIFLLTAGLGVWASYNQADAWHKFWRLAGGVLLFYALAGQPDKNRRILTSLAGILGAAIGVYFLFTHNWKMFPADLSILNRLAAGWMSIRPDVQAPTIHPNIVGGLLAMLLPINLVVMVETWQKREKAWFIAAAGCITILATGLLMTSSRAAWLSLAVGLATWGWWLVSGIMVQGSSRKRMLIFSLPVLLVCLLTASLVISANGALTQAADSLPGMESAGSRLELARDTLQLVRDYPITGAGLASFSWQYSTYIRLIQVPVFYYSHNLYTDIALEQGLPGLAAFLLILAGAIWVLWKSLKNVSPKYGLPGACLVGLVVMVLHGTMDDALYGMGGTPLLLLIPGVLVSLQNPGVERLKRQDNPIYRRVLTSISRTRLLGVAFILLLIGSLAGVFAKTLASTWYANQGAVAMSRLQHYVWPYSSSELATLPPQTESVNELFEKSLAWDANNATALYRMGILRYNQWDFDDAVTFLEPVSGQISSHRGIQKLLGYTYTWTGETLKAKDLLIHFPEAVEELDAYTWWWDTQNQADLAMRAQQMAAQLRDQ